MKASTKEMRNETRNTGLALAVLALAGLVGAEARAEEVVSKQCTAASSKQSKPATPAPDSSVPNSGSSGKQAGQGK